MPKRNEDATPFRQPIEPQERELPLGLRLWQTLKGHDGPVYSIAFDSTGNRLASGSDDGTIKLWDMSSGKLLRTLEGQNNRVISVAFDLTGRTLASGSGDGAIKLWGASSGKLLRTLEGHNERIISVAFNPKARVLASGSADRTIKLWDTSSGKLLRTLEGHKRWVISVAFDPKGRTLASGSADETIKLWDTSSGKLLRTLEKHNDRIMIVAFTPSGHILASGSADRTVKLWDTSSGKLLRTLEGHTGYVYAIALSADGRLMATKGHDGFVCFWNCETWEPIARIREKTNSSLWVAGIAFHPTLPLIAMAGSDLNAPKEECDTLIHIWDLKKLLGRTRKAKVQFPPTHHTTAKIVLVGDAGVGKTGLGWRLAHGEFKEHSSTHGQQFWVLDQLGMQCADRTQCEAILWDLAGQSDYRLIHALFLDDADLALVLFDPTDSRDPLHGVEFWLEHLKAGRKKSGNAQDHCPTILIGARSDLGEARLTQEELDDFCNERGICGFIATSAKEGIGLDELKRRIKEQISWGQKAPTSTTVTFKRIKEYVLGLKENRHRKKLIVSPQALRKRLEKTDRQWKFTDAEIMTAVRHLANYGYVCVLRTSKGEERILLAPELLNNLAASLVLEARRNPKDLGSLEEKQLLDGEYQFGELEKLFQEERDVLLDSAVLMFLEHNICFRQTDPLNEKSFLVFPALINMKKPLLNDRQQMEDGVAYTVSGAIENVYASLVVLLGYTQTFTRTNQWHNQACYKMGDDLICGFRQEAERDSELDFVLYFGKNVIPPVRTLFQGLFENFLARRNLNVFRYEPVVCSNGHSLNRTVVREQLLKKSKSAFCPDCGENLTLPKADEPIQLTQTEQRKIDEQQWFAARRSLFEQVVFQIASYVENQKIVRPECFISYAWGDNNQERWVERNLATDLQKAGINIVLDRWENVRVGASVSRFVERIEKSDRVIVVGTPLYRKKYDNKDTKTGYVVAAEVDVISNRLLSTEAQKETVLPVLLAGEKNSSLPALLHSRVFADFRNERDYFTTAFDLILNIYAISHGNPAVADLRESLREPDMR